MTKSRKSSLPDGPAIYVADLAAYNNGKLVGEWVALDDFSSADDLMERISELLKQWSDESGEEREEYAIHDTSELPNGFFGEGASEVEFELYYEAKEAAEEIDVPSSVVLEWMSDVGHNNPSDAVDAYYGKYDSMEDMAYDLVEQGVISNPEYYMFMTDTDRRILAGEEADNYVDNLSDDDLIEMAGMSDELSELESRQNEDDDFDFDDEKEELVEGAKEKVRSEEYDRIYDLLENPEAYFVDELGAYAVEDLAKADFISFDYEKLARELELDYTEIRYGGELYVFSKNFKRGGSVKQKRASKFSDKVKSIASRLKGTSVKKKYQKDYGKRYDQQEANEAARRIAGAQLRDTQMAKGGRLDFSQSGKTSVSELRYYPKGMTHFPETLYTVVDQEFKTYHKDGKFRKKPSDQVWSFAYKTKEQASRVSDKLNN